MIDYGRQRSTLEPQAVEITATKVFVATDVQAVSEAATDGQEAFVGWEYDLVEYDKDEYIQTLAAKTAAQEADLTAAQLALCEVYEMIGG